MITNLQDGDIIDDYEVKLISSVLEKLTEVVKFCNDQADWFVNFPGNAAEALEWLNSSRRLLKEIDNNGDL